MRNIVRDSRLKIGTIFDLRFAICDSGNRRSRVPRPGFWIFSSLLLLSVFMVSGAVAQVTHLRILNADGAELASLELLQRQSTKYVLEKELREAFNGARIKHERLVGRITITMMGKRIVFTLDQHRLRVDGKEYVLSMPPVSISGRIAIPVEFLTEILPAIIDNQVTLDQQNWVLKIKRERFVNNDYVEPDAPVSPVADAGFRVIIDPGHGGRDTGSRTKIGRLEKDQTLKVAQKIKDLLASEKGIYVYLTRNSDKYMTTTERVNRANDLGGHVYLSIHFNWSPSQRSKGYRIYVNSDQMRLGAGFDLGAGMFSKERSAAGKLPESKRFLSHSKRLAKDIAERLRKVGLTGEREKEALLADMDDLSMPGVLVEVLYFSNQQDLKTFSNPGFISYVSRSFRDSILNFRGVLANENPL